MDTLEKGQCFKYMKLAQAEQVQKNEARALLLNNKKNKLKTYCRQDLRLCSCEHIRKDGEMLQDSVLYKNILEKMTKAQKMKQHI